MKSYSDEPKRVGIWIRVSTEDQVRGESPEHHERRARLYAEAKGWEVIEVYRLDAISGKTVKELPDTKRMLSDVKDGHITGLIFSKLARLARNTKELLEFAEFFREYDADLISLAESIDTSTPAGRLFYTMIAAMAQWEREEIAARVAASVPIRAKMGKPLGGQPPFGYQWVDKVLCPHPEEAPVRKLIYELFREHRRKKTVARILNERGYRTRNGSPFSDTTVDRLLRDPTAKGIRRANYTSSQSKKKAWELKPESEWVLHKVEAIISEELWTECNAYLDDRKMKGKRTPRKTVHLFAGIAHCACGQKMYVPSNTPKYVCYACRNKIPVVDLEGVFHEQIKNFFFSPEEIAAHLRQANDTIKAKEELLEVLLKEQKRLVTDIDNLHDLYRDKVIDKAGFGAKYHPIAERQRQLEDEIPQAQAELDVLKISQLSQEEIITSARNLYGRWPDLPQEEKRRIVEAITDRIIVSDGEVEINLFYAPPVPKPSPGTPSTPSTSGTPGGALPPSTPFRNDGRKATRQCPCGYFGHPNGKCRCTPDQIARYRNKISGPLLDRIDIQVEVPALPEEDLLKQADGEPSAAIRERAETARQRQLERQGKPNALLSVSEIEELCVPNPEGEALLRQAIARLNLSARAYHRVLKVARTIADLAGSPDIETRHVATAVQYRRMDL